MGVDERWNESRSESRSELFQPDPSDREAVIPKEGASNSESDWVEMNSKAITVSDVWKSYRLYHQRNQHLKSVVLNRGRVRYEEFWALKDISFEVTSGETFGIIGSNGSGKSTLLKCLANILAPERGELTKFGRISALLELGAGFHHELSGRENIFLNGAILGLSKKRIDEKYDAIVEFSGLQKFVEIPVKNYSSGMIVRLGFAIAAHVEPDILLVDEVLSVGDEAFQQLCAEKIEDFRREGRTIILVSHGLGLVEQLCERTLWLEKGEVRMIGSSSEVITAYKGDSHGGHQDRTGIGARWGSFEVEIIAASFVDDQGDPMMVISTLDSAKLRLEFAAHIPVQKPVFGVRIDTLNGQLVWGSSSKLIGHQIAFIDGNGWVDLNFPKVPLLNGTYDLSVSVTNESETHQFDHWERRIRFEVRQLKTTDAGLAHISVDWDFGGVLRAD